MWAAIRRFFGRTLFKAGPATVKGLHVVIATTLVCTAVGAGVVYNVVVHREVRTVVITINGVNTSLTNCHYSGDSGLNPSTFLPIQNELAKNGFYNPYMNGCPNSSSPFSSGPLDIAEYSYDNNPGQMIGDHWVPNNFDKCASNTHTLEQDSANLASMIDQYRKVFPHAQFEIVGHSLGGLVALRGATDYLAKNGSGVITKVITLDSPLHGRSALTPQGAEALSATLNVLGGFCTDPNNILGQTLNALAGGQGNLPENEVGILTAYGASVYTLGNFDDCLYQQGVCETSLAQVLRTLGGFPGTISAAVIDAIPDEEGSQYIDGAYKLSYRLGNDGSWPGGHGAILVAPKTVAQIAWFLTQAPSATITVVTPPQGPQYLHVIITAQQGIKNVKVQILTTCNDSALQSITLNGNGATTFDQNVNLSNQLPIGRLVAQVASVTDGQGHLHSAPPLTFQFGPIDSTLNAKIDTKAHDYYGTAVFDDTMQPLAQVPSPITTLPLTNTITEFPVPQNSCPGYITAGRNGDLWFPSNSAGGIGRIASDGKVSMFIIPGTYAPYGNVASLTEGITIGKDGDVWFTETGAIGRITPDGNISAYPLPFADHDLACITVGPDGNLWFADGYSNQIGYMTPTGAFKEFPIPSANSNAGNEARAVTMGPDGNMWFTESGAGKIGRVTLNGKITEFPIPFANSLPEGITAGPDGNLWFVDAGTNNSIGRITLAGNVVEYPVKSGVGEITAGPDDNLWFTDFGADSIGRITPTGDITEFPIHPVNLQPGSLVPLLDITAGSDGNLWFTETAINEIGRITP